MSEEIYGFDPNEHDIFEKDGVMHITRKGSNVTTIYMVSRPGYIDEVDLSEVKDTRKHLMWLAHDLDGWED